MATVAGSLGRYAYEPNVAAALSARRLLGRCIRAEHYNIIIAHTTLASFFTHLAVKGMPDRPKLVSVMHGYLFDDAMPALKRSVMLSAERLTAPQTDLLLVMNDWDYQTAMRYRLAKQVEKIPGMGVDFSRLDRTNRADGLRLRATLGIPEDAFVLLYAAEFSKRKSQHVLIRAMKALPENTVLVLCGSGATWTECRTLAGQVARLMADAALCRALSAAARARAGAYRKYLSALAEGGMRQ